MDQRVPMAHVAKFNDRLRLIRSVLRASKFSELKLIEIVIVWVNYTIPFAFNLFRDFKASLSIVLDYICLAKDHWRGFSTRNAHMVHIVYEIRIKMVYTSKQKYLFYIWSTMKSFIAKQFWNWFRSKIEVFSDGKCFCAK